MKKKSRVYRICLLLFSIVLICLSSTFLAYVYTSLVSYEENLVENYINTLLNNGKLAELYNPNFEVNKYEKSKDINKNLGKLYKNKKVSYVETGNDEKVYSYDIKYNDKVITKIDLEIESVSNRIGLLKINNWKVKNVEYLFDNGFYEYEITIPENYLVYINNVKVDEKFETIVDNNLTELSNYTTLPKYEKVTIKNFITEPNFKVVNDEGEAVKFVEENNKISYKEDFKVVEYNELVKKYDFNVLEFAENWSLFLTNDLGGYLHGFYTLKNNLIEGNHMYDLAYTWATGVDITFVSNHILLNPRFENEKVEKCTVYNDEAFSCIVNLDKKMKLTRTSEDRTDTMHEELYFVYKDGVYKLIDMKSVETE